MLKELRKAIERNDDCKKRTRNYKEEPRKNEKIHLPRGKLS